MALVSGLLLAGTLNIKAIVEAQGTQGVWFLFCAGSVFHISLASIAETNRRAV